MANVYLVPNWFFGLDVIFESIFAIITLIVSIYSFKVYRLSGQKQAKLFSIAFAFFSVSYIIQSILNIAILSRLGQEICTIVKLQSINVLNQYGIFIHMIFFIIGLVTLTYVTLKIDSPKTFTLLLLVSLISILISINKIYWYSILSSILLAFIVLNYISNFSKQNKSSTLLVLTAFIFLLFGHIHFIFAVKNALFYAMGHFFELIAYILILINLYLVLKK